jgi:hypothetical protein
MLCNNKNNYKNNLKKKYHYFLSKNNDIFNLFFDELVEFVFQRCKKITQPGTQFYFCDRNGNNKIPVIPESLNKLIRIYNFEFIIKSYKFNQDHSNNQSHSINGNANYKKCKSIINYENYILNLIHFKDAELNPILSCEKCKFQINEKDNIELVYITLGVEIKCLDLRKKCFTNDYTFRINHKNKNFHFYPESHNDNDEILDENTIIKIEICKKFFIETFEFVDPIKNIHPCSMLIPLDEILEELKIINNDIDLKFLIKFIYKFIDIKSDKFDIYEKNVCFIKYKKYDTNIIYKRIEKCKQENLDILNLSGLNLTNNKIKEFSKNIPDNIIMLNISYNEEISSLKELERDFIKRYFVTKCKKITTNELYNKEKDKLKFFNVENYQ